MSATTVDGTGEELTLPELERASAVPARTIRYYQSEGLLPRPERRGGRAVYTDQHLERLGAIASLRAEGLKLQTIRQVLGESVESGSHVVELLGPSIAGSAWLATSARTLDEGELADLLGDLYPEQVPALVRVGYLERRTQPDGRKVWYAQSVPQLRGALEMFSLGTDFELSRWSAELMRERIRDLCEVLVTRWVREVGGLYAGEGTTADFQRNLERIRSVAWQSAAHVMAEEIGVALRRADEIRLGLQDGDHAPDAPGR